MIELTKEQEQLVKDIVNIWKNAPNTGQIEEELDRDLDDALDQATSGWDHD